MISPVLMYFIVMGDSLSKCLDIFMIAPILVCIFYVAMVIYHTIVIVDGTITDEVENSKKEIKTVKSSLCKWLIFVFFYGLLNSAVPNTKQMAVIYVIPKLANSDFVQKEMPKETRELYDLAKEFLKEKIKDGMPQKTEKENK